MNLALGICVLAGLPASGASEVRAFVDDVRRQHGLSGVRPHDALQAAAQSHLEYMVANNTIGHAQSPGKQHYTARTAGERTKMFGYVGRNSEALSFSSRGLKAALEGLFVAPYHRVMFLQPNRPDFGAAATDTSVVVKLGGETGDGTVFSPPNNGKNVPTTWDTVETPDPLRNAHIDGPIGYPIVVAFFGKDAKGLRYVSSSLRDGQGKSVPVLALHPGNDRFASSAIILLPHSPLRPGATYRFEVAFANQARQSTVGGSFSTAK